MCLIGISLLRACTVRGPIFPPKESLRDWKKGGNPVLAFVACFEMGGGLRVALCNNCIVKVVYLSVWSIFLDRLDLNRRPLS